MPVTDFLSEVANRFGSVANRGSEYPLTDGSNVESLSIRFRQPQIPASGTQFEAHEFPADFVESQARGTAYIACGRPVLDLVIF